MKHSEIRPGRIYENRDGDRRRVHYVGTVTKLGSMAETTDRYVTYFVGSKVRRCSIARFARWAARDVTPRQAADW